MPQERQEGKSHKIYVCEACAKKIGASTDSPYMYHICETCGDGPTDLYEADDPKYEAGKKDDA